MSGYRITVPATTANLGPGFDAFGLALGLYAVTEYRRLPGGYAFENVPSAYANEDHYALRAFRHVYEAAGKEAPGVLLRAVSNEIPISRGLGSSAVMFVSGAVAASLFLAEDEGIPLDEDHPLGLLSRAELLRLTTELEGHPDNLAPALYGGFCMSVLLDGRVITEVRPVSTDLRPVVLVPDYPLLTKEARAVLPAAYPRADAVFNLSRAAMLPLALERGDGDLLAAVTEDRIHEPYRRSLIHDYDTVREAARSLGARALVISGAGPTLLAFFDREPELSALRARLDGRTKDCWEALAPAVDHRGASAEAV